MGLGVSATEESGGLSSRRIWGSQQQKNLGVTAAEESGTGGLSSRIIWGSQQQKNVGLGVSVAELSGGLSSRRIWEWGSQQQNNLRVSAAEEYGTGGLSSRRIWGSQQQMNVGLGVSVAELSGGLSSSKGVSAACRVSSAGVCSEANNVKVHRSSVFSAYHLKVVTIYIVLLQIGTQMYCKCLSIKNTFLQIRTQLHCKYVPCFNYKFGRCNKLGRNRPHAGLLAQRLRRWSNNSVLGSGRIYSYVVHRHLLTTLQSQKAVSAHL